MCCLKKQHMYFVAAGPILTRFLLLMWVKKMCHTLPKGNENEGQEEIRLN